MKINKKILTIGSATLDLFIHYDKPEVIDLKKNNLVKTYLLLEQGCKLDIQDINYYTGGGATNTGIAFKRLGFEATSFFKIAKDSQGKFVLNELKKERLKTKVVYSDTTQTAMSFILPTPSGDRIILAFRGANRDIIEKDIPINLIKKSDQLYITPLSGFSSKLLEPIINIAKQNNIPVTVNPGISQLKPEKIHEFIKALKHIDTLILNTSEAKELMLSIEPQKVFTFENYLKLILKLGPLVAVVTDGSRGVYVANKDKIHFQKSIPSKAVSTLGAGDAFGACFVASLLNGKTIEEAALYGTINASNVIQFEGAKTGLLTWEEIEKKAKN